MKPLLNDIKQQENYMSRPKHKPTYTLHQGFRMPMGFPADCFESGLGYQAQAGDNFIVNLWHFCNSCNVKRRKVHKIAKIIWMLSFNLVLTRNRIGKHFKIIAF